MLKKESREHGIDLSVYWSYCSEVRIDYIYGNKKRKGYRYTSKEEECML